MKSRNRFPLQFPPTSQNHVSRWIWRVVIAARSEQAGKCVCMMPCDVPARVTSLFIYCNPDQHKALTEEMNEYCQSCEVILKAYLMKYKTDSAAESIHSDSPVSCCMNTWHVQQKSQQVFQNPCISNAAYLGEGLAQLSRISTHSLVQPALLTLLKMSDALGNSYGSHSCFLVQSLQTLLWEVKDLKEIHITRHWNRHVETLNQLQLI